MPRGLALLSVLLSVAAVSARGVSEPASGGSSAWRRLVEPLSCSAELARQISDWGVTGEVLRGAAGIDGRAVYRFATERLGHWVTLIPAPEAGGVTRLVRTDGARIVVVTLGADCRARWSESAAPVAAGAELSPFTDRDLEQLLSLHPSSIVYLWSPHLPLSVEGYRQAARAAEARGLGFAAVLHPSADGGFARREAEAASLPREACRPLASVELLFRDLALHAPAILAFVDGHPQPPLPGYRSEAGYLEYLDRLARR